MNGKLSHSDGRARKPTQLAQDDGARRDVPARAANEAASRASILVPGRNCWRVARTPRFRCVQDGELYFRLVREAILEARKTVFILGWDIAAGVDLLPDKTKDRATNESAPTKLGELLDFVARERRDLRCYVLIWDYAAVYALERDPFSRVRLGWRTPRRVQFRYDAQHPYGSSHHQKIVVVDDAIAFSGGLDLTAHRWDTSEHPAEHPLRVTPLGQPYTPFHDVQALVDGPIAASLGELARERWHRSGGGRTPRVQPSTEDLWPDIEPDITDADVAIARTLPDFRGHAGVREVEALFLDSIAAARSSIYIENQYFTNPHLGEALAKRLREEQGPEVIAVGPKECSGWLEQKTMGALRQDVFLTLLDADRHRRLRLLSACVSRACDLRTFVHAKVMAIDDELFRIGSANFSSRSMGMDTECDIVVEARGDPRIRAAIRRTRDRLMAEHLEAEPEDVGRAFERTGSLRGAIDAFADGERALVAIEVDRTQKSDVSDTMRMAADPDEPMRVTRTLDRLLPEIEASEGRGVRWGLALPLVLLGLAWAAAWRWTDLTYWAHLRGLQELIEIARTSPSIVAAALGIFALCGLLFVPFDLLALATIVVFGPLRGGALSYAGAGLAAAVGYFIGRAIGPRTIALFVGERSYRLQRQLQGRGSFSVAALRLVPIVSSTAVNLLCGAARVPLAAYATGTAIGLVPPILALCLLAGLLRRTILEPSPTHAGLVIAAALALALFVLRLRSSLFRRQRAVAQEQQRERAIYG